MSPNFANRIYVFGNNGSRNVSSIVLQKTEQDESTHSFNKGSSALTFTFDDGTHAIL
jgi:hypothetical protein